MTDRDARLAADHVAVGLSLLTFGQAFLATDVPETEVGTRTPTDLGFRYEDVVVRAADGVDLAGWYLPSVDEWRRRVVAFLDTATREASEAPT